MSGYYNMNDNNINDNKKKVYIETENKDSVLEDSVSDNIDIYVQQELNIRASVNEDKIIDKRRQANEYNAEMDESNSPNKVLILLACMAAVVIGVLYMAIFKSFGNTKMDNVVEVVQEENVAVDEDNKIVGGGDVEEIQINEDNLDDSGDVLDAEELEDTSKTEAQDDLSEEQLQNQSREEQSTHEQTTKTTSTPAPTKDSTKDNIKEKIYKLSLNDDRVVNIYNNFSRYPLNLMKDIIRNNEMIDYAAGYLDGINKSYYENIDISSNINYGEYKIPLLIQWDDRWGYYTYGKSTIGISGCGPTSLNMVYLALKGDITMNPLKMAKFSTQHGYCIPGVGTSWSLMTEGANRLGLKSVRLSNKESLMRENLQQGKLIIGSMGPGTFTDKGHFIVFSGYENGKFRINDPFCIEHSRKAWDYREFGNQIKALWVFSQ